MRLCIIGAGAIGGALAVRLAQEAGADDRISLLARGAQLAAIRAQGLRLIEDDGDILCHLPASDLPEFGVQDVLVLAVKAHALPDLVAQMAPMIGPQTRVMPMVNGVPWWYFQGQPGRFADRIIRAVDPNGSLAAALPPQRLLGCVVYMATEMLAPGVVRARGPHGLVVADLAPHAGLPAEAVAGRLKAAGIATRVSPHLRDEIWTKLMANLATNPLSVVAGATLEQLYGRPDLRRIVDMLVTEIIAVAAAFGARLVRDPLELARLGAERGAFPTSMLQDYRLGRKLELGAIGDAVLELAAYFGMNMPNTRTILDLARFRDENRPP